MVCTHNDTPNTAHTTTSATAFKVQNGLASILPHTHMYTPVQDTAYSTNQGKEHQTEIQTWQLKFWRMGSMYA